MLLARALCAVYLLSTCGLAFAQGDYPARADTVSWSVQPAGKIGPGRRLKLVLGASVQPGWHVYALKQAPDGPTPLLVGLDPSAEAVVDGPVTGSPATRFRDPAFGLDTEFYAKAFTLTVPVRLKPPAGRQAIPVSVRFQTCNGRICQPPRTVRLSAPLPADD